MARKTIWKFYILGLIFLRPFREKLRINSIGEGGTVLTFSSPTDRCALFHYVNEKAAAREVALVMQENCPGPCSGSSSRYTYSGEA